MAWKRAVIGVAHRLGVVRAVGASFGRDRLTVLAYHRVTDPDAPDFDTFRGNVSATPAEFEAHLDHLVADYSVVDAAAVTAWLRDGIGLPPRPVLITFDDGYRDNLEEALPLLRARGLPALLFAATAHIGSGTGFWWDVAAHTFHHAAPGSGGLPLLGERSWDGADSRVALASEWVAAAKRVPDDRRAAALDRLVADLGGDPGAPSLARSCLGWDDVRSMTRDGFEIGAHTRRHPILTKVPLSRVAAEIAGSRDDIAAETGTAPDWFAYPNGQPGDLDDGVAAIVREAGFLGAFTLSPGPARLREIRADPFRIRRIYVHHGDDPVRFAAKLAGVPRLLPGAG